MEFIPSLDTFTAWLIEYGGLYLFVLLALGIVALPIPEETLMVFAGAFMSSGRLPIPSTIAAAYLGSICGISLSYALGRTVGLYFIHKYGRWFGLTEKKLRAAHRWFEHYGKWSLIYGYFIPGIRHFTGLCAGATYLDARHFTLFAYSGALVWVSTFLSLGYFFGNFWPQFYSFIEVGFDWIFIGFIVLVICAVAFIAIRKAKFTK